MVIDLKSKVAVVTGAGAGIGLGIAKAFAKEGAKTVVLDVSEQHLENIRTEFEANGYDSMSLACDVRSAERTQEAIDEVVNRYGTVDVLVNNAGVAAGAPVESLSEDVWDMNIDVNLKGPYMMSKAVIPVMKKQKSGRIINAASFAAIIPRCNTAAYAASKAGVVYFTRVLAGELGPWNITVNCYAPGMVPTGMNHYDELPEKQQKSLLDMLTIRRWEKPDDVANLVCFLASDLAGYITGAFIDVSGGKLATQMPVEAYESAQGI